MSEPEGESAIRLLSSGVALASRAEHCAQGIWNRFPSIAMITRCADEQPMRLALMVSGAFTLHHPASRAERRLTNFETPFAGRQHFSRVQPVAGIE